MVEYENSSVSRQQRFRYAGTLRHLTDKRMFSGLHLDPVSMMRDVVCDVQQKSRCNYENLNLKVLTSTLNKRMTTYHITGGQRDFAHRVIAGQCIPSMVIVSVGGYTESPGHIITNLNLKLRTSTLKNEIGRCVNGYTDVL